MPTYTLTTVYEVALYADGVKVVVAANNTGATILIDIFKFIQNPQAGNSLGVKLPYVATSKAWTLPNGSVVLFDNTNEGDGLFLDVSTQIKNYGKVSYFVKPMGKQWGFLATDKGVNLLISTLSYIEVPPQDICYCPVSQS